MNQDELKAVFDQQASGHEQQQKKLAPIHEGLYFQLEWIFSDLPGNSRVLCVGLGAGAELSYLASKFPNWSFTAVEPSGAMLNVCRQRAKKRGLVLAVCFMRGIWNRCHTSHFTTPPRALWFRNLFSIMWPVPTFSAL